MVVYIVNSQAVYLFYGYLLINFFQVTLKENASEDKLQKYALTILSILTECLLPWYLVNQIDRAKDKVQSEGGTIKDEFSLIKGFSSVSASLC